MIAKGDSMNIMEYQSGSINGSDKVTYIEVGSGPLVYFSSDSIPEFVPIKTRGQISDTFCCWQNKVNILGQLINGDFVALGLSMDGRQVSFSELEHLCGNAGIKTGRRLYFGPFNESLLGLVRDAVITQEGRTIIWKNPE